MSLSFLLHHRQLRFCTSVLFMLWRLLFAYVIMCSAVHINLENGDSENLSFSFLIKVNR